MQLALSHLGYRPDSPKTVTLCGVTDPSTLPEVLPFYLRQNCLRMPRNRGDLPGFPKRFPCPFDLLRGPLIPEEGSYFYQGELRRIESQWGTFWQGDFSNYREPGSYQIEIDQQISAPFLIADWIYDRLQLGYLRFLQGQRCGCAVPGVHPACHLDDGVLDMDGTPWIATGGWHDAGDFRKWLSLTTLNLGALVRIARHGHPAFRSRALEEIAWGNRLFHRMMTEEGRVFEDVAGGSAPAELPRDYDLHWWFENHPGCYGDATDNRWTDNCRGSGDERMVRTTYNPMVQLLFVAGQAECATVLPDADGVVCRALAERGWKYARSRGHDGRTVFLAQELLAALALGDFVPTGEIEQMARELLSRQETRSTGITGFFWEKDRLQPYRSIAYAGQPALALLACAGYPGLNEALVRRCREAVELFCDGYLVADAGSNPFAYTPYGVFWEPVSADQQTFRDAGGGLGIRSFMPVFNEQSIVHGTSSVITAHADVLAMAARLLNRPDWKDLAERQLQWLLGHNTLNRSLFNGIGYRQPVAYGFRVPQIPEGTVIGFIGRQDDSPYLEESFAIEWNTLEHWDVPFGHAIRAVCGLNHFST
jgi:hypothetical protein